MAKGYLDIKVDTEESGVFIDALQRAMGEGWRRDNEYEMRYGAAIATADRSDEFYIMRRELERVAHYLFIRRRDAETLYVANIFPEESGYLTDAEYNGIQRDFQKQVEKTGYPSVITREKATLVLSKAAEEKLVHFVREANASTGTIHPADQRLWMQFLVTAHRDGCVPDGDVLYDYMIETFGWQPKVVSLMETELEFGNRLLRVEAEMRTLGRRE